jgi:hypothetical protein
VCSIHEVTTANIFMAAAYFPKDLKQDIEYLYRSYCACSLSGDGIIKTSLVSRMSWNWSTKSFSIFQEWYYFIALNFRWGPYSKHFMFYYMYIHFIFNISLILFTTSSLTVLVLKLFLFSFLFRFQGPSSSCVSPVLTIVIIHIAHWPRVLQKIALIWCI